MERQFNGLDIGLNAAVWTIARKLFPCGWQVAADAPDTLDKLCASFDAHKYVVYSGGSDQTIFDDAETNYAFRAWHDYHHWQSKLPFDRDGETDACRRQCLDLVKVYGISPTVARWCKLLQAEIIGQLEYAERHNGEFPTDQKAFVSAYLDNPNMAIQAVF